MKEMHKLNRKEDPSITHNWLSSGAQNIDYEKIKDPYNEHEPYFEVTMQQMADKPISKALYSHFVEIGYGVQIEGMWSEMFFNRSFEEWQPYKPNSDWWFGLRKSKNDPNLITDWTRMEWYHSNYEHNAWFAAPGSEGRFNINPETNFFINSSSKINALIRQVEGGVHGKHCLLVENHEDMRLGGLGQQGKYLRKGVTYKFTGLFKDIKGAKKAYIHFYPENCWDKPIATFTIEDIGSDFSEKTIYFENNDFEGKATFALFIPPKSTLKVDCFSLMPEDSVYGWRKDVVEVLKRVNPSVIRFPGGCFASFYNWRKAVGPRINREPEPSYFWGALNYNDVGTDEFAMLCRELGSDIMMCINMFHPYKEVYRNRKNMDLHGYSFPQFISQEEGIKLAADWVAYCNAPQTHPMGKLRAEHGYPEPFNIKYWEMDNESYRWFDAIEYAKACVAYAKAMKAVDPDIMIGLVSYGEVFGNNLTQMIEIAGSHIDFIADRDTREQNVLRKIEILRNYNNNYQRDLKYCNTEWLAFFNYDAYTAQRVQGMDRNDLWPTWGYALGIFNNLMMWQRFGGDVLFANFNNLANTHAQSVIETPKEGAFMCASGYIFELMSRSPASRPLVIRNYTPNQGCTLQVQVAWDDEQDQLVLYALNRGPQQKIVTFELSELHREFNKSITTILSGEDTLMLRTVKTPNEIVRKDIIDENLKIERSFEVTAPKFSFVQVILI